MIEPTDKKVHFKMYKKGRFWVFAGIAAFTWQINTLNVHADTTDTSITTTQTTTEPSETSSSTKITSALSKTTNEVVQNETETSTADETATNTTDPITTNGTKTTVPSDGTTVTHATDPDTKATTTTVASDKTTATNTTDTTKQDPSTADTTTAEKTTTDSDTTDSSSSVNNSDKKTTDQTEVTTNTQEKDQTTSVQNEQDSNNSLTNSVNDNDNTATTADKNESQTSTSATEDSVDTTNSNSVDSAVINKTDSTNTITEAPVKTTTTQNKTVAPVVKVKAAKAAVTDDIASDTFGDSTWRIDSNGILHIGAGTFVNTDGKNPWSDYADKITSIVFEGEVNAAADSSFLFNGMSNVKSVTNTSNFKTTNLTNMRSMFANNTSLTSLDLSSWDTGKVTNMQATFYNMPALSSLNLSGWNTSNVTNMASMFDQDAALAKVDVSTWNTSKVKNMGSMFYNASKLTSLSVSGWNTSNVTSMKNMFRGATSLASLDVSNWDTGNVTTMSYMFYGNSALRALDVSGWNTSKVTDMSYQFYGDSALSALDVSNWKTSQVTDMSYLFYGDSAITVLNVGNWDTTNVTNMRYVFYGLTSITALDVANWNTSKVTNLASTFRNMPLLTSLDVSKWDTSNVTNMNSTFMNLTVLQNLAIGNWDTSKVTTMAHMFSSDWGLNSLDVSKWQTGNVTDMSYLFYSLSAITKLDVANWNTSKVTTMAQMFDANFKLTTLDVSKWNTSNVTDMNNMFYSASALTTVDVSKWDTGQVTDMNSMFDGAINLVTVDVSNWNTGKVTNMSYMFWGDNKLTTLDVSNWNTSNVTDMSFMFVSNWVLGALDVTNWDTSKVTTMENMFAFDEALTTLNTSNWKTGNVTNMSNMFNGDINLTSVDVSGWDTSNVTTMAYMFWGNNKLVSLDVSKWNTGNVTDMSFMFVSNWVLGALDVSNWDTSKVTTMENMFAYDEALTTLNTSNWKTGNVTNMSKMFAGDFNLTAVDVSGWDTSNVTTMFQMFWQNNNLIMLDVSGWDTSKVTDMTQMFWANGKLTTLDVSGWDTSNVENMYDMFDGDASLTVLDVSKWNTGKVTDMRFMFWGTSGLKVLDFSNWDMSNVGSTTSMLASTNLQKIILGANNKWSSDTGLPDLTADATYSGNWISNDTKTYNSSDLLANNVAGTYIRELATSGTTVDANDSAFVAGPDATWDAESNFAGAKDYYGNDLNFADVTVSGDTVNTKVPGTYHVTYSYTDITGNTIYKTIAVTVTASTAAVETTDKTVELGDNWDAAANFTGVDTDGSNVDFSHVTVAGDTVNTKVPGTYNVTYSFKDSAGNLISKTIQVVVYGIILNDTNKEISTTSDWTPAGNVNKATNVNGDELAGSDLIITITDENGQVVTSLGKPGTYIVTYTFFSRARSAETYSVSATITVTNKASLDVSDSTVKPGNTWSAEDNFKGATDENGDAIDFSKVTVSGDTVNTNKPGDYKVTYTYTDDAGNATTKTITVTVSASEASLNASDSSVKVGDAWNAEDNFNSAVDANGTTTIDFSKVTVSGDTVNAKVPGIYYVTYSFVDVTGAAVSKTVKVIVYGITLDETDKTLSTTANWDPATNIKQAVNIDGTTADVTVTMKDADGKVVTSLGKPGTYTVTYAIDSYTTSATVTVTSKASLDVSGSTVKPGDAWSAEDNFNGATDENGDQIDFSKVTVSGSVDTTKPGSYDVIYTYTDDAGNSTSQKITVTVSASEASLDASDSSVKVGDAWSPEDNFNSAVDANGTTTIDFSKVTVSGNTVDTKVPGTYNVTYSFIDVTGKPVSKTVKVIVYGITLTETDKTLSTTANWDPKTNVNHAVNADGTTADVTVTMKDADGNIVKTLGKPGTYTITYAIDGYTTIATVTVTSKASLNVNDSTVKPGTNWDAADNFISATDENGDVIDFSKVTVSGSVDTTKPGSYDVTYTYTDAAGNPTWKKITVTVSASEASLDASNSSVKVGDTWHPENNFNSAVDANGTTTIDFSKVTVSGDTVNTKVPGTYTVTYSFVDVTGATVSKTVKVIVYGITLNETDKTLSTTNNWDPTANIKQAINADGTTADVTITMHDVDGKTVTSLNKPGTYTVTYAIDGYTTTATVTVTSQASLDVQGSTVKPGSTWNAKDNFIGGTDENGDALDFSQVTVSGTVNTNKPGSYDVTYTYADVAGNAISQTVTITVSDSNASIDAADSAIKVGSTWNAKDNFNNAVNADGTTGVDFKDVTVSGDTVNTEVPGTYNVTYSFTDSTGATITKTVKVVVYGITLNETDKTLSTTNNWDPMTNIKQAVNADGTDAKVTVTMTDADGKTVTSLTKPGIYTITYTSADDSVTATVTITNGATLNVVDSTVKPGSTWNAKDNFIGGTNENSDALDFNQITVTGSVNTNKPGSYKVTYTYTDAAGNETSQTITITVSDTNANIDANDSTLKLGDAWNAENNFNAAVNADGTTNVAFKDVTVSGDTVNTNVPGTYNVTYTFKDSTGATISKTVKVVVYGITLNETNKEISTTSNWDPTTNVKKATNGAGDELGGSDLAITIADETGKTVTDLKKPGTYTVTYSFMTRAGESFTTSATIVVTNKASLNVNDATLTAGDSWKPADNFVSGTDENGDALNFSQITVTGNVDTNTAGTYKVSYSYTDANGDSITKVITVTVTAKDTDGDGDTDTGDTGNGNGGTDTDDNNGDGDTNTGDNNNGDGDTDTGDTDNNGGGNTDTGNTDNNGNGTDTDESSDGDAINNGNNTQTDDKQSEGDTVAVKPVAIAPANSQAKSAKQVSLKTAAKQVNGQADTDLDQLPQTNEQSTNRAATAGVVLLALGGLVLGLGKAVLNRRHN